VSKTEAQLLEMFKAPAVPLAEISERYLNQKPRRARVLASLHQLPFPTFRLTPSQKSPLMVQISDLAAHIDAQHKQATSAWENSQV